MPPTLTRHGPSVARAPRRLPARTSVIADAGLALLLLLLTTGGARAEGPPAAGDPAPAPATPPLPSAPPLPTTAAPAPAAPAPSPSPLAASFTDGFTLGSSDGRFKLRIGGMVQADGRWFPGNTLVGPTDGFQARSVRLQLDATLWSIAEVRVMTDFSGGQLRLFDAYVDLHVIDALRLRAGKFKVPFGLERLQQEGRSAFMERAFPTDIAPNRDLGVMLWGEVADRTLQWAVGVFNGATDNSTDDRELDADKEEVARLFVHPGRPSRIAALRDLGVGGAVSFGQLVGTAATPQLPALQTDGLNTFFRFNAGAAPSAANTALATGSRWRATAEAYYYVWRLGLFGEYVWNRQDARLGASQAGVTFQAWQGYATLLLTDDVARFDGVQPRRPLLPGAAGGAAGAWGPGAWEVGFRYSGISISDQAFVPGTDPATGMQSATLGLADPGRSARGAASWTVGVNWYLSGNAKVQVDYVRTDFRGGAAAGADRPSENAVMGRVQVHL